MQHSRSLLGGAIGNLRLIDYAENRRKSNAPFAKSALQPASIHFGATEVLNATEPQNAERIRSQNSGRMGGILSRHGFRSHAERALAGGVW